MRNPAEEPREEAAEKIARYDLLAFPVRASPLARGLEIALVVAMSMVIIVIVGSILGMSLPFLLSKQKTK